MHRVVWVRGAQNVGVAACSGQPNLSGPRDPTRGAEQLRFFEEAHRFLSLPQITKELGIRVKEGRTIFVVMVADLMAGRLDARNQLWMKQRPFANEEEGGLGVV